MSLKAKLEAVIYAAEEPVTLNQLAALFAADALEWKAAQEAAAAEQTAEVAGIAPNAAESLPLIEQVVETSVSLNENPEPQAAPESTPAASGEPPEPATAEPEPGAHAEPPASSQVVSIGEAEAYSPIVVEDQGPSQPPEAPAAAAAADAESEAKRLVRQRDREVKVVIKQLLDELIASSQADGRGIEIREIAGGYRMATKPECHDAVRLFVKSLKPPLKLSMPALETLAVIAYKQPVTAPEVNEIRGVESSGVLGSLLARKLIATAGRKPVIGRPILYKTTREFLLRFGLKDVSELPSMEEFEKMAATELEMEPEVAEADRAEEAAERAGQDAETEHESNSPSGEEVLATAEAGNGVSSTEKPEGQENAEEQGAPAAAGLEPPTANDQTDAAEPAEPQSPSGASNQSEATLHAEESKEEV